MSKQDSSKNVGRLPFFREIFKIFWESFILASKKVDFYIARSELEVTEQEATQKPTLKLKKTQLKSSGRWNEQEKQICNL